jgi:hypothetical protein
MARSPHPTFEEVRQRAHAVYPSLLASWLPDGQQRGRYWLGAKNPTRNDRRAGSFVIDLAKGSWRDYATDDHGGDAISLYAYLEGLSQGEACHAVAAMVGLDPNKPVQLRVAAPRAPIRPEHVRDPDRDAVKKRAWARDIWRGASSPHGTPVEHYLRRRGFTRPIPPSLRFARLKHPQTDKRRHPVMIAAMQVDGAVTGVHRTYLTEEGDKAGIADDSGRPADKLMLGTAEGTAVRLSPSSTHLVIAEGIESALSALEMGPDWTVWAALSAGNLPRLAIPLEVRRLVIFADGEERFDPSRQRIRRLGLAKAQEAMTSLKGMGVEPSIVFFGHDIDLNDILRTDPDMVRTVSGYLAAARREEAGAGPLSGQRKHDLDGPAVLKIAKAAE